MAGLILVNELGNKSFIPFHAIDRMTIMQKKDFVYSEKGWLQKLLGGEYNWEKIDKWAIFIETNGGKTGTMNFDTKEDAEKKLGEI